MANKNINIFIGILVFAIIIFFFLGSTAGVFSSVGGTVTRTNVPSKISVGSSFTVIYSVSGTDDYGVSIEDHISGGCTFSTGLTYKSVSLSSDLSSNSVRVTIPAEATTCVLSGDYKFGTNSIQDMTTQRVIIVEGSECSSDDDCASGEVCSKGLCIDEDEPGVIEDGFLRKMAIGILGVLGVDTNNLTDKELNTYVVLTIIGLFALIFFIFKLIFTTPK